MGTMVAPMASMKASTAWSLPRWTGRTRISAHAGGDQELLAGREPGAQRVEGGLVLRIRRVEKRDQHVGVESYRRHSSRCPGGYVPAGTLPANRAIRSSARSTSISGKNKVTIPVSVLRAAGLSGRRRVRVAGQGRSSIVKAC
jgi:hypothetical protein